jgi:hypothetical protein
MTAAADVVTAGVTVPAGEYPTADEEATTDEAGVLEVRVDAQVMIAGFVLT